MSRSSSVTELATITRKNSTTNNKTTSLSRQSTKVKIAHRTRSKCPINDRTLNEIEADLPDDLLIDNQNTNGKIVYICFPLKIKKKTIKLNKKRYYKID